MPSHHPVPHDLLRSFEPVLWGLDAWTALIGSGLAMVSFQLLTSHSMGGIGVAVLLWASFLVIGFGVVDGVAVRLLISWAVAWLVRRVRRPPDNHPAMARLTRRI